MVTIIEMRSKSEIPLIRYLHAKGNSSTAFYEELTQFMNGIGVINRKSGRLEVKYAQYRNIKCLNNKQSNSHETISSRNFVAELLLACINLITPVLKFLTELLALHEELYFSYKAIQKISHWKLMMKSLNHFSYICKCKEICTFAFHRFKPPGTIAPKLSIGNS